jgi:uncharacterized protein YbjT (DUF2867 family)
LPPNLKLRIHATILCVWKGIDLPNETSDEGRMHVFVTGGTGYIGSRLIPELLARGHRVAALTRPRSAHRLAPGCRIVIGDALNAPSYAQQIDGADTLVHLIGVAHPGPAKAMEFRTVDSRLGSRGAERGDGGQGEASALSQRCPNLHR